jgi:MerR family transcriptional regulator, redox-sensitive transcriptional activator SoxR
MEARLLVKARVKSSRKGGTVRSLPIGELARSTRVRASALRYWEGLGLLPGARREAGRRTWPATAVRRVALIKMAQRSGFTLAEIRRLLDDGTSPGATRQWRVLAARKLPELDAHIAQAQALRQAVADCLECGCMNFDKCALLDAAASGPAGL